MGILAGITVIEMGGIGPAPFCGMLLADLGAEVIVVERPEATRDSRPRATTLRGKKSIVLDLATEAGRRVALELARDADAVIEGMRPGVMERLGLGPAECMAVNSGLVYGRITGWGQEGPGHDCAGHDSNYLAIAGALWFGGQPGTPPAVPPTLLGDVGGALYLAVGLLAAIRRAVATGQGEVIDTAIVDTAAHMMNLLLWTLPEGATRGQSRLDGPHWAASYRCSDGGYFNLAALEPQFYSKLMQGLGLEKEAIADEQHDREQWPVHRRRLAELFATRSRDEWAKVFEGSDACAAPVLGPWEAARHPLNVARGTYVECEGRLQALPAPRFANAPPVPTGVIPDVGADQAEILSRIASRLDGS